MRRLCGLLVLLALPPLVGACGDRPAHASPRAAAPAVWRTLGTWSGRGSSQTGSFDVTSGALRVRWTTTDAAGGGRFCVALHSAISGRALQTVVDTAGAGGGVAYVQDEPRVSYFEIEADAVDWRITLEEAATR